MLFHHLGNLDYPQIFKLVLESFLLLWATISKLALDLFKNYYNTPFCSLWGGYLSFEEIFPQFLLLDILLDNSIIICIWRYTLDLLLWSTCTVFHCKIYIELSKRISICIFQLILYIPCPFYISNIDSLYPILIMYQIYITLI
jgi:hypothetical protein